jgi:hypothetical protein
MLKEGKAKVEKRCPFTVKLTYDTSEVTQELTLGVDAGSKHIGLSVTNDEKEYYAAEVELRSDIVAGLSTRRELRDARRNRKTRHRKARFNNRKRPKGWLAPSVKAKADIHLKVIEDIHKMLPISEIRIETASFDIQKLKADMENFKRSEGDEYQKGDQLGFWNVREYVLCRDSHECQCCHGRSKDPILNIHHIESRKTGGNAPNNLVTLCETCHKKYHKGEITLPDSIKRKASFKDAAFMGIMRWYVYEKLKDVYPNVHMTFGYMTKNSRIENGLEKSHIVDARCISGHPLAIPSNEYYYIKKVRCHNRQIHKMSIGKGGIRKRNQAEYLVKGFRLNDVVKAKGKIWFVHGRRKNGSFVLKTLSNEKLEISPNKIKFVGISENYITERRKVLLPAL